LGGPQVTGVTDPAPTRGTRPAEEVAADVERAREETNPEPTAAQTESGNYARGKVSYHGLPFVIETPLRARDGALLPGLRGLLALPLTFLLVLVLVLAFSFTPLSGRNSTPAASKARCRAVLETLRHARLLYHCLACPLFP